MNSNTNGRPNHTAPYSHHEAIIWSIVTRTFIPYGQMTLYWALYRAPFGLTREELAMAIRDGDVKSLTGVLGALGNRVNKTEGLDPSYGRGTNVLLQKTRRDGQLRYVMRDELRTVLSRIPKLREILGLSLEQIKSLYRDGWWQDTAKQASDLSINISRQHEPIRSDEYIDLKDNLRGISDEIGLFVSDIKSGTNHQLALGNRLVSIFHVKESRNEISIQLPSIEKWLGQETRIQFRNAIEDLLDGKNKPDFPCIGLMTLRVDASMQNLKMALAALLKSESVIRRAPIRPEIGKNVSREAESTTPNILGVVGSEPRRIWHRILHTRFDLKEIEQLCFDIDVNIENLAGQSLIDKSRALVTYLERREKLGVLEAYIKNNREDIKLASYFEGLFKQS